MEANIVSNGQFQTLNRIKNYMKCFNKIDNFESELKEVKNLYQDILDMKNSDNSKEFLNDIKNKIKAINLILNV